MKKILLLLFLYPLLYSYPPGWSDDILLTPEDEKYRGTPDISVDSFNNVWVVWDSATWAAGTGEALYSKRDSLGGCLIPETNVSNNTTYSIHPRIAVDGSNNVQIVWHDETPQGLGLWHAKLRNDGAVIVPSHMAVMGSNQIIPFGNIAINKYKEVNICWDEVAGGTNRTVYTKLDSMGNPVIYKKQVSLPGVYTIWNGMGVDSFANNHLGYRSDSGIPDRLTYTKLDKDGNILIDNKFFYYYTGALPTIIADRSQNIHMVYCDPSGPGNNIKYLKLDQSGNILVYPKRLNVHENNNYPHMAMDSLQYLHVVWEFDNFIDTMGIMYTKLDTLGNFVIPPMKVVYPPYSPGGGLARIAVDRSNRLHLVWVDGRLNPGVTCDIFYKRGENEHTVKELARLKAMNQPKISVSPNPFVTETRISFSLSHETEKGRIEIFDILGRRIKEFCIDQHSGTIHLNGRDNAESEIPSGIYLIRISDSKFNQSIPVVLLK